jgi:hypothetical protein
MSLENLWESAVVVPFRLVSLVQYSKKLLAHLFLAFLRVLSSKGV